MYFTVGEAITGVLPYLSCDDDLPLTAEERFVINYVANEMNNGRLSLFSSLLELTPGELVDQRIELFAAQTIERALVNL